jgi:hypothetical protein
MDEKIKLRTTAVEIASLNNLTINQYFINQQTISPQIYRKWK